MSRRPLAGRAAVAALLLASLAACAEVGPNYRTPDRAAIRAPAAQGGFLGANIDAVAQAPVPDGWWRLYDDPVLDDLERQALAANSDLRVAAANLGRAQAVVAEAKAVGEPSLGAQVGVDRADLSAQSYLLTQPLPAYNLVDAGLSASYEIDLVGRIKRISEAAHADAEASQAALDLARVGVAAQVAQAYLEVCASGDQLAVAQRAVAVQQRTLEVTRRLAAAGRGAAMDVTRAQGLADQLRAAEPGFEAQRRAGLFRLAALTGKPPADYPRAAEACAEIPHLARPIPVGDGAALLRRRPDVRQAERQLAGATARIGVAVSALYPTVSLGAATGTTGLLQDFGQPVANRWSFGALVHWSLPGGGERARIRESRAGADAALARFDGVVLNALRETETSLTVYAHDLDRNADLRAARDQAQETARQTARLRAAGRSPYLSGLDAARSEIGAEAAVAASDAQVAGDQINLFLALGGGWGQAAEAKGR